LKLALAVLGKYATASDAGISASAEDLVKLVQLANLCELLRGIRGGLLCSEGRAVITPNGFVFNKALGLFLRDVSTAFAERGRSLHLADKAAHVLLERPLESVEGIQRVLSGEPPSKVEQLHGTIFGCLNESEPYDFWAGIWARLVLYIAAIGTKSQVTNDHAAIAIVGDLGFGIIQDSVDPLKLQHCCTQLFWTPSWLNSRTHESFSSLIQERPILRISASPNLYVTSPALIIDSLNFFVETSFIPSPHTSGVRLPERYFKQLLSQPFEKEVARIFEDFSFQAGPVSENGIWLPQKGPINPTIFMTSGPKHA
jgi:hypothetical protein